MPLGISSTRLSNPVTETVNLSAAIDNLKTFSKEMLIVDCYSACAISRHTAKRWKAGRRTLWHSGSVLLGRQKQRVVTVQTVGYCKLRQKSVDCTAYLWL